MSRLSRLSKDELIRGSFVLFFMIVVYNFFNYVFQISMARLLGPEDYSILAVLMSLIYFFSIPSETIQTIITKHTSNLSTHNSLGKIKDLLIRNLRGFFFLAIVAFGFYLVLSWPIASFLSIDIGLVMLTGLFIFIVFSTPIVRGILQGTKQFFALGSNMVAESVVKLVLSVLLVIAGLRVYGAMTGVIVGCVIVFALSFIPLKKIVAQPREKEAERFSKKYLVSFPIMIATLSVVLFYSIDIILARAFFPPEVAGQFAFVSLIGKVIIFVSSSIGKVMFPLSTEKFESGNRNNGLLKKSLLLVLVPAVGSLILYFFFPELIVFLLSLGSREYLPAAGVLFTLGLAYSFLSMSNIIVLHGLSINKIRNSSWFLLVFVAIEVVLLSLFHETLAAYSLSLLLASALMFIYSAVLAIKISLSKGETKKEISTI